jgi:hypothetical protein
MAQDIKTNENQPQPINIWLECLASSAKSARDENPEVARLRDEKDEAILTLLARMSLHYWRPDFSPGQARELYLDYLDDLRDFAISDIAAAMRAYRRDGENRFFPTSGQIVDLISGKAELIREFGPKGPTDMGRAMARRKTAAIATGQREMDRMIERRQLFANRDRKKISSVGGA